MVRALELLERAAQALLARQQLPAQALLLDGGSRRRLRRRRSLYLHAPLFGRLQLNSGKGHPFDSYIYRVFERKQAIPPSQMDPARKMVQIEPNDTSN